MKKQEQPKNEIVVKTEQEFVQKEMKFYDFEKITSISKARYELEKISLMGTVNTMALARALYLASKQDLNKSITKYESLYDAVKDVVKDKDGKNLGKTTIYNYAKVGEFIQNNGLDSLPKTEFTTQVVNDKNEIEEITVTRHNFTYSQLKVLCEFYNYDKAKIEEFAKNYKIFIANNEKLPTTKEFEQTIKTYNKIKDTNGNNIEISKDNENIIKAFTNKFQEEEKKIKEEEKKIKEEQKTQKEQDKYIKDSALYIECTNLIYNYIKKDTQVLTKVTTISKVFNDILKEINENGNSNK